MAIEINIHSGFDQAEPHLTVELGDDVGPSCEIKRYRFTSSDGEVLLITQFKHKPINTNAAALEGEGAEKIAQDERGQEEEIF